MAGGAFRFGTASIYIAGLESIRPRGTSHKRVITWLRFETVRSSFPGLPPICSNGKKEARVNHGRSLTFSLPSSAGPRPDWCFQSKAIVLGASHVGLLRRMSG